MGIQKVICLRASATRFLKALLGLAALYAVFIMLTTTNLSSSGVTNTSRQADRLAGPAKDAGRTVVDNPVAFFRKWANPWTVNPNKTAAAYRAVPDYAGTGCEVRLFTDESDYLKSEFVEAYLEYRRCLDLPAPGESKIRAFVSDRGQLQVIVDHKFDRFKAGQSGVLRGSPPDFLFLVMTGLRDRNKARRDAIRSTWGHPDSWEVGKKTDTNVSAGVYFVLPKISDRNQDEVRPSLEAEGSAHGDLIELVNVPEVDRTEILLASLGWAFQNWPGARYLMITSDETYVRPDFIQKMAKHEKWAANRIYGKVVRGKLPDRDPGGVHPVSLKEWPWAGLPQFVEGPSVMMSMDVVPRLLFASTMTPKLKLANLYLTGLLPMVAHVTLTSVESQFRTRLPARPLPRVPPNQSMETSPSARVQLCPFMLSGAIGQVPVQMMGDLHSLYNELEGLNLNCSTAKTGSKSRGPWTRSGSNQVLPIFQNNGIFGPQGGRMARRPGPQ